VPRYSAVPSAVSWESRKGLEPLGCTYPGFSATPELLRGARRKHLAKRNVPHSHLGLEI